MYQQITLIGNLGNDPEMRYTPGGDAVASFRMAVNKKWTSKDGQAHEKSTWFRITVWRKQAEIVSQYLAKGSKVLVIGEVEEGRAYLDKQTNEPRASLEITASVVKFLDSRGDSAQSNGQATSQQPAQAPQQPQNEEEIPF